MWELLLLKLFCKLGGEWSRRGVRTHETEKGAVHRDYVLEKVKRGSDSSDRSLNSSSVLTGRKAKKKKKYRHRYIEVGIFRGKKNRRSQVGYIYFLMNHDHQLKGRWAVRKWGFWKFEEKWEGVKEPISFSLTTPKYQFSLPDLRSSMLFWEHEITIQRINFY